MTAPTTRLSYGDAYDALDRAKDDAKGIRLRFPDYAAAATFRSRLHYARQVDRRDNSQIYEMDDPLYGRSAYDPLVVRIKQDTEGAWWVYIEHASIDNMIVESLSEIDDVRVLELVAEAPQRRIEPPREEPYTQSLTTGEPLKRRF